MRKLVYCVALAVGASGLGYAVARADDHEVIEEVMKTCMKGGLCKKVASGEASAEEKAKLLESFQKLAAAKPEKGEEASWKEKTAALVAAAQEAVDGKATAGASLMRAANCKSCHDAHKPS